MNNRYLLLDDSYVLDSYSKTLEDPSDEKITLNSTEAKILCELVKKHGECVSRSELFHSTWEKKVVVDNSLNVAIASMRKKLTPFQQLKDNLITVTGEGYLWAGKVEFLSQHPKLKDLNIYPKNPTEIVTEPNLIHKGTALLVTFTMLASLFCYMLRLTNII